LQILFAGAAAEAQLVPALHHLEVDGQPYFIVVAALLAGTRMHVLQTSVESSDNESIGPAAKGTRSQAIYARSV
jgi:hypothetical protein